MSLTPSVLNTQEGWCPRTIDDTMPSVIGLLPPGPVWDAAAIEGTVQYSYWRATSSVLAYFYSRSCDYVNEFFCATVNESVDQWNAEFGMGDPCDPYGNDLCLKVAADGGANCAAFVEVAARLGWVITCDNLGADPEPVAGCFEVGCTPLGPTPVFVGKGDTIGYGQRGACDYGEVVEHPDPSKWENGFTKGASCPVPGSNLGEGPGDDESCCFIVGFYDFNIVDTPLQADFCQSPVETIFFDCPRVAVPADLSPCPQISTELRGTDDNGNYSEWGLAFVWEVGVDAAASTAAQQAALPPTPPDESISMAGAFMVGLPLFTTDGSSAGGAQLCALSLPPPATTLALCFLDQIKPAHTQLIVKVV